MPLIESDRLREYISERMKFFAPNFPEIQKDEAGTIEWESVDQVVAYYSVITMQLVLDEVEKLEADTEGRKGKSVISLRSGPLKARFTMYRFSSLMTVTRLIMESLEADRSLEAIITLEEVEALAQALAAHARGIRTSQKSQEGSAE